jgi:hypothetical protein
VENKKKDYPNNLTPRLETKIITGDSALTLALSQRERGAEQNQGQKPHGK